MKKIVFFALIVLVQACKINTSNTASQSTKASYSLSKSACFGTCPVFNITIERSGSFVYQGKMHVEKIGNFTGQFEKIDVDSLFMQLADCNWSKYPDEYAVDNYDFPQFQIEYFDGATKKAINGNSNAAIELLLINEWLEKKIAKLTMQKR